jgi:hypothetical protein
VRAAYRLLVAAGVAVLAYLPHEGEAQSLRITGSTTIRYLEVRPLVRDSVPVGEAEGNGLLRQTGEGRFVRCIPGEPYCRGTRAGHPVSTVPAFQDLEMSAWGFGEGIRLFAHLRGRAGWGERPELWPRSERGVDVLSAYGELDRDRFRVRAGRQWTVSGLGFYNFDGVTLTVFPLRGLSLDGYAGRSLVRGLNEPRTGGAVEAIEALAPEEPGVVLGVQARYRPTPALSLGGLYHLDLLADRSGLYSELARADGVFRFGDASLEGSLEMGVASAALNEARLLARSPLVGRTRLQGEIRRYRPYFELWTIWGAFSPVGFDEARIGVTWAPGGSTLIVRGDASYRRYDDAGMETSVAAPRTDGWGLSGRASWSPQRDWRMEGGYGVETGFGGARGDAHLAVNRSLGHRGSISARALAFQRVYEFRLDEGTVLGAGTEASLRLSDRTRGFAGLTAYRHIQGPDSPETDWNQLRGSVRLQWTLGPEPGVPGRSGGGR